MVFSNERDVTKEVKPRSRARDILARSLVSESPTFETESMTEGSAEESLSVQERLERSEAWIASFIEQLGDGVGDVRAIAD